MNKREKINFRSHKHGTCMIFLGPAETKMVLSMTEVLPDSLAAVN